MVSVIIPNYNHSIYLAQRIDSILNQTYKDYELIILDDCSDDDSRKIIGEYVASHPEIITSFNLKNSGSAFAQWNHGVSLAKGEYIWIAESDDSADVTFLEKTRAILNNNPNAGLVYCDSKIINEIKGIYYYSSDIKGNIKHELLSYLQNGEMTSRIFLDNPIVNVSSVLFRRDSYIRAGWADSSMTYCGDWFLYLKMLENSDIHHIKEPLNIFRLHSGSTCFSIYRNNKLFKERLKIYSCILKRKKVTLSLSLLMLKKLIKVLAVRTFFFCRIDNFIRIEVPAIPIRKYIIPCNNIY
jgi:glycosyltransferase involved in cell wall biosynthesis